MSKHAHFSHDLFKFLRQLRRNNAREWFRANTHRYESDVREPLLRFIAAFGPLAHKISPCFVVDPNPVGGSLFRIYRDTRFSRDKSPYKTMAAAQFRHEEGKDVHAPGSTYTSSPEMFSRGPDCGTPTPELRRRFVRRWWSTPPDGSARSQRRVSSELRSGG